MRKESMTPDQATSVSTSAIPLSPLRETFLERQKEIQLENSQSTRRPKELSDQSDVNLPSHTAKKHGYVFTGADLLNMPLDKTPHLWEPFMCKQGLAALTGSSDVGKSSLLRDLAIAIVLKESSFLGHPLNVQHGRVIYYTTEENQASISEALKKQADRIGKSDLSGLCFIFNEDNPTDVILEQLLEAPTDLVIMDCFADIFKGRLNDNSSVRDYLQDISQLSIAADCLFILLHHNGKRTEYGPPDKNNIIGSQGFEAKVRLTMELRKELDGSRTLWFTKGNNLPDSYKKEGLKLSFDENQHFTLVGKSSYVPATINNKFINHKEKIMQSVLRIQELFGKLSQDKILVELKKEFGTNTPSKGTFNSWMKERKRNEDDSIGQSVAA